MHPQIDAIITTQGAAGMPALQAKELSAQDVMCAMNPLEKEKLAIDPFAELSIDPFATVDRLIHQ